MRSGDPVDLFQERRAVCPSGKKTPVTSSVALVSNSVLVTTSKALVTSSVALVFNSVLVTTSKALVTSSVALVTSSVLVTTSKALVTSSVALVTSSFLFLLVRHLLLVAWHFAKNELNSIRTSNGFYELNIYEYLTVRPLQTNGRNTLTWCSSTFPTQGRCCGDVRT